MERITCRCGWNVYPGLDCDFCGIPADELASEAATIAEVLELPELRTV